VPTQIYYPKPLHQQGPYLGYPVAPGGLPVTERLVGEVLSLPMHPYLTAAQAEYICEQAKAVLG
jgi:dTDP-4-amino-4,6-dideoxygalactose transaminase